MVLSREETLAAHKAAAGDVRVMVAHGAVKSTRDPGGWAPQVWECGRELCSPWARGLTLECAEREAEALATEHAKRFCGDYVVELVHV